MYSSKAVEPIRLGGSGGKLKITVVGKKISLRAALRFRLPQSVGCHVKVLSSRLCFSFSLPYFFFNLSLFRSLYTLIIGSLLEVDRSNSRRFETWSGINQLSLITHTSEFQATSTCFRPLSPNFATFDSHRVVVRQHGRLYVLRRGCGGVGSRQGTAQAG